MSFLYAGSFEALLAASLARVNATLVLNCIPVHRHIQPACLKQPVPVQCQLKVSLFVTWIVTLIQWKELALAGLFLPAEPLSKTMRSDDMYL